jgi:hypothetical protein
LLALSAHWWDWLRPLDTWFPPEGDAQEQSSSLIRHLFALYDVPRFLDAAWLEGLTPEGVRYQGWYKHIGRGQNIRTAKGLPLPLTKRMSHHFVQAPPDFPILAAYRCAQVLGLGGDERLAHSLLETRIGTDFQNNDFSETVIRWFIDHPSLDQVHHGPIIDYLHCQKFVASVPNPRSRRRGQPRGSLLNPPQPNLCMKGRTPTALLRAIARWHEKLCSEQTVPITAWRLTEIPPLVLTVGVGAGKRIYETTELICTEELQAEGVAMRHCVASYWEHCASAKTSIWSMTVEDWSGQVTRLLTLEARNASRLIVQARGPCNCRRSEEQLAILAHWKDVGGPSLSRWLLDEPGIEL